VETTPLIWSAFGVPPSGGSEPAKAGTPNTSPFHAFMHWSDWLHSQIGRTDSIALVRLMELLFMYLTRERGLSATDAAETMWRDYQRVGRRDQPEFLRPHLSETAATLPRRAISSQ